MKRLIPLLFCGVLLAMSAGGGALAHESRSAVYADGHAPIGVMGDHLHKKGEFMLSYRAMLMDMSGMRDGTNSLSAAQVFARGFMVTPTEMQTEMHMVGGMYAPTDYVTLMLMGSWQRKEMDHLTMMGARFSTQSEGFGDVKISSLIKLYDDNGHKWHLNAGLSLPTGSVEERDVTPMSGGAPVKLPYPMQIGSGTVDFLPGITYSGHAGALSWGAQYAAEIRLNENSENYSLGDKHALSVWGAYRPLDWLSTSLRLRGQWQGDIDGADAELNPMMVPTAAPGNHGGERVDLSFGLNLAGQRGALRGHRLAAELTIPVFQDLNGPQMESEWMATIGWQKAFGP